MDAAGAERRLSKRELRKQKLMEYLAEKGKLRPPNSTSYLQDNCIKPKKVTETFVKAPCAPKGKENQRKDPPTQRWKETQIPGGLTRALLQATDPSSINCRSTTKHTGCSNIVVRTSNSSTSASLAKMHCSRPGVAGSRHGAEGGIVSSRHNAAGKAAGSQPSTARPLGPLSSNTLLDQKSHKVGTMHSNTLVSANSQASTATSVKPWLRKPGPRTVSCKTMAATAAPFKSDLNSHSTVQTKSDLVSASSESHSSTRQVKVIPGERQYNISSAIDTAKPYSRHYRAQSNRASNLTGTKHPSSNLVPIRCQQKDTTGLALLRNCVSTPKVRISNQVAGLQMTKNQAHSKGRASALYRVVLQAMAKMDKETCQQVVSKFDGTGTNSSSLKTTQLRTTDTTSLTSEPKESLELVPPQSPADQEGFTTVPRKGKQKLTAAQEERLRKLQEWRKAKGISYKRPPMPIRPSVKKMPAISQRYWNVMEAEDEVQRLVCTIDSALADCLKLVQEGCPTEQVTALLSRLPVAQKFAKYWICQARLMERAGNLEVLPLFEQAVQVVLEPVDELRDVIFEILKKTEEVHTKASEEEPKAETDIQEVEDHKILETNVVTPKATTVLICGTKEGSSVVKYKITATPGGRKSQKQEPVYLDGKELHFFTPVRRSVRIEQSAPRYPAALQEHDPCVASFRDLLAEEEKDTSSSLYIYRENEALGDQVQLQFV
ncbi:cytoskeleton-associated protein 2-like [Arapaima gigas]